MPRCLFICKNRNASYGVSFGLVNSAGFVANALRSAGIEADVQIAVDANEIDRLVTRFDPTHVYIEALWVPAEKLTELLSIKRHQSRRWIVRIHSKAPFLANEGIAFPWLMRYRTVAWEFNNFHVSCNSEELNGSLSAATGLRSIFLPNIYSPPEYPHRPRERRADGSIDIGCFGAIRPLKNHLNQALAAIAFADLQGLALRFHVNGDRNEQSGDQVQKNLRALFAGRRRHELVEHPWLNHDRFCRLVCQMDLGMQVSLSETFNIVAADFVTMAVPIITSPDVDWMPRDLCADPNSVPSMIKTLQTAMKRSQRPADALARWNSAALAIWLTNINH